MLSSHVRRLRFVGYFEGTSFLLLLFVAMPLKYWANLPEAVFWIGWAHGVLFVLYMLALAIAFFAKALSFWKSAAAFIAAFLPFGPFVFDRWLVKR